ncbi:glycosyltransferase [Parabacteroides sp. TM07-1AC]|uniref:glycosyltransferase family 2 protein n=2 Tax=Parabacteroides TaxID=375288 RepID=UPI000EFFE5E4|nr:glycosyltransferase [Parabacteroides sp. TM07-1AC]RHU26113.1 glycosyltransferase [Parabacteroides sp. TM07-1AC]
MMYAPIIVSVYDRLEHLRRCVESLKANKLAIESILYVVSDAAYKEEHVDKIRKVRDYISSINGFKEVRPVFREKNLGAQKSIGLVLDDVLSTNDSFIFLEDDIVVSNDFLQYLNDGLAYYREQKNIFAICGFKAPFDLPSDYKEDVFFYPCNSPWGFATWKDRWESVNHDYYDRYSELKKDKKKFKEFLSIGFYIKGILQADSRKEIVAGDLRVYYHMFQHNMCSVFPVKSKTQNWGFDGTGEHCGDKNVWWAKPNLGQSDSSVRFISYKGYNDDILKKSRSFQDEINGGFLAKYLKYTWLHDIYKKLKRISDKILLLKNVEK